MVNNLCVVMCIQVSKILIYYANIAERDTETDRQTDTQTDRQTSRQADGQEDGQSGVRQTQRYGDGEEERGQTELLKLT